MLKRFQVKLAVNDDHPTRFPEAYVSPHIRKIFSKSFIVNVAVNLLSISL